MTHRVYLFLYRWRELYWRRHRTRRPHDCAHGYGCCAAITPRDCPWGGFEDWVGMKEGGW